MFFCGGGGGGGGGGWWVVGGEKIKSAVYLWAFSTKSDEPWHKFLKRKFKKKIKKN